MPGLLTLLDFGLTGVSLGAIIALSAMGLVLTYRATGVFNLAHGAIAMIVAYALWQTDRQWHWPLAVAAPVALLLVGPGLGYALSRLVFTPLQRSNGGTAEQLVASLGVFVLLVGVAFAFWGGQTRSDAPALFPGDGIRLPGGVRVGTDTIAELALVAVLATGVQVGLARTRVGRRVRAVVDQRELADLAGVDVVRVSSLAWMVGCGFAGLTGVLLAPAQGLDPYRFTLVVIETFAAAVAARLSSLPTAVAVGLGLGVAQSELAAVRVSGFAAHAVRLVQPNLLALALLAAVLLRRRLADPSATASAFSVAALGRRRRPAQALVVSALAVAATAALGPLYLAGPQLRLAQQSVGLAIILLSIVAVTGYSGQVSLGQSGLAGIGALVTGGLASGSFGGRGVPELPALGCALATAVAVGLVVGLPALRRRGLSLALTTLAVAEALYRLVFLQSYATTGLHEPRPAVLGARLDGDRAFYAFELGALALVLLLLRNLRSGRLGRILGAIRDSPDGARSLGLDLRRATLFIFAVSAGVAALGGALFAQAQRGFDATTFDPLNGLLWFVAVVVAGTGSALGAVLAAAAMTATDAAFGAGSSAVLVGGLALALGRIPGGLVPALRRWAIRPGTARARPDGRPTGHRGGAPAPGGTADAGPSPARPLVLTARGQLARSWLTRSSQ